jgi:hypothetical protein
MVALKFYGHFAAAIGTLALAYLFMAAFSGGEGLMIALAVVAAGGVYAAVRMSFELNARLQARVADLERRLQPAERQAA